MIEPKLLNCFRSHQNANQIIFANHQANGQRPEADQDPESIDESVAVRRVREDRHTMHRRLAAAIRTVRPELMELVVVRTFEAAATVAAVSALAAIRVVTVVVVRHRVRAEAVATTRAVTMATERRRRRADAWACSACV